MRPRQPPSVSDHRLARFLVWFGAVLAWFALRAPLTNPRHQSRHAAITSSVLVRAARNLIIIRAATLVSPRGPSAWRDFSRWGVHRRNKRCSLRRIGGAWLRRQLKARGGVIAQATHLIQVMRRFRALTAAFARRRRNGLTRLRPLILAKPWAQAAVSLNVTAPRVADSS